MIIYRLNDANNDGYDEHKSFLRKLDNRYQKYATDLTGTAGGGDIDYEREFLKFINLDYDLGISLYETDSNLTSWRKIELSPTNPNGSLIKTSCK